MSPSRGTVVARTTTAAAIGTGAALTCAVLLVAYRWQKETSRCHQEPTTSAYESLVGSTPLVRLNKLSSLLGNNRSIYVKMECMNPGGTGKDRAALRMIQDAEKCRHLPPPLDPSTSTSSLPPLNCVSPSSNENDEDSSHEIDNSIDLAVSRSRTGGIVVEGTSGSTGISLASLCAVRGHSCIVVIPDDQAKEKQTTLRCLGAVVHVVPNAAISNPNQYVNVARRIAKRINTRYGQESGTIIKAAFINQFENLSNYMVHRDVTGPELWSQSSGKIDAFVMSSGTGGTIAGVGQYLKSRSNDVKVVLVDPPGSALYNKIEHGVAFASQQCERSLRRNRYDTLAEGIGLDRITANFSKGCDYGGIDQAVRVSDQEAVDMAHWLLREEGIFVGSSSAMNVVGAVRVAAGMPSGRSVVTIICDGGQRHLTRFWNRDFIEVDRGLQWPDHGGSSKLPDCLESI